MNETVKKRSSGGVWCVAFTCENNSKANRNLSYFRFPKDAERSSIWARNCGREDLLLKGSEYLYKNCRLCSIHFKETLFLNDLKNRLHTWAIPTLFDVEAQNLPLTPAFNTSGLSINTPVFITTIQDISYPMSLESTSTSLLIQTSDITPNVSPKSVQTATLLSSASHRKNLLNLQIKKENIKSKKLKEAYEKEFSLEDFKEMCDKFLPRKLAGFVKFQASVYSKSKKRIRSQSAYWFLEIDEK